MKRYHSLISRSVVRNIPFLICIFLCCHTNAQEDTQYLSRKEAELFISKAWNEAQWHHKNTDVPMWEERIMKHQGYAMPFDVKVYGQKPADGRSLFISMHGGGNTAKAVNDQQWRNQTTLYTPSEGVYIAPRAAVDDWNMWFRPHIDTLFSQIIRCAVSEMDVNPNKVYLLGYSAGGDGVYRMAPRMADYWAAASMMAGHPGEASPVNLKNIGFMLWMGENDAAYNRNKKAEDFGMRMDSLQNDAPGTYLHKTCIVKGCGHWMNRADTAAIGWMSRFIRNPRPRHIVWRQEESGLRDCFYNLSVPREEMEKGRELHVEYDGNTVLIRKNDYNTFYIHLNDKMMNLSRPIVIICNGNTLFKGKVVRRKEHIIASIEKRMDSEYIFSAMIEITDGRVIVR